jgi:hypothetical protein
LTLGQVDRSVSTALSIAQLFLKEGRAKKVLFGAVDELSEVRQLNHQHLYPHSQDRLTEGAAFFVLSDSEGDGPKCVFENFERINFKDLKTSDKEERVASTADRPTEIPAGILSFHERFGRIPTAPAFDLVQLVENIRASSKDLNYGLYDFDSRGQAIRLSVSSR